MTISDTDTFEVYTIVGATTPLNFGHQWEFDDEIVIFANGTELDLGDDYSLVGAGEVGGGTITPVNAEIGSEWTVWRMTRLTQLANPSDPVAGFGLDRNTRQAQDARRDIKRAFLVPVGELGGSITKGGAGKFLSFDADQNIVPSEYGDDNIGGVVGDAEEAAAAAAASAGAAAGSASAAATSAGAAEDSAEDAAASANEAANILTTIEEVVQPLLPRPPATFAVGGAVQSVDINDTTLSPLMLKIFINGAYQWAGTWSMDDNGIITPVGGTWPGDGIVPNMQITFDPQVAAGIVVATPTDGSVTTVKLFDGAVTYQKLAPAVQDMINDIPDPIPYSYATRALALADTVPAGVRAFTAHGYATLGDCPRMIFIEASSEPAHIGKVQTADGRWWVLKEPRIMPSMLGILGNGTDEGVKIQQMWAVAQALKAKVVLEAGKTYGFSLTNKIDIPSDIHIENHFGAYFKEVGSGTNTVSFTISGDRVSVIPALEVEFGGGTNAKGVEVLTLDNIELPFIRVTSRTAALNGSVGSLYNAVILGPASGQGTNYKIGRIEAEGWDRPFVFRNTKAMSVQYVDIDTYRRGLYLFDCPGLRIYGGHARGRSANSMGVAGDNAILMESLSHGALADVRIYDFYAQDAGEHGIRAGGNYAMRDIWLVNILTSNSGSAFDGVYPPQNNGGCGIKVLGSTATASRHQGIHIISPQVRDINATSIGNLSARGGDSNFAGIQIGKCIGVSIVNPIICRTPAYDSYTVPAATSCYNGIELIGCEDITITNPNIDKPFNSGIFVYDFGGDGNDWGVTNDLLVTGGKIDSPGKAGVQIVCAYTTMRRLKFSGLLVNGGQHIALVEKSGVGAFVGLSFEAEGYNQTVQSFEGLGTDGLVTASGNFVGANACRNGSTYQDIAAGFRQRKAGSWVVV